MKKIIFITIGTISLGLGIIGIIVPGLPTTVFLLISSALYLKSSPRLYNKLVNHKITGKYLNKIKSGISLKTLLISSLIMWTMILVNVVFVFDKPIWKIILILLGIIGSIAKIKYFLKKNISKQQIQSKQWKTRITVENALLQAQPANKVLAPAEQKTAIGGQIN